MTSRFNASHIFVCQLRGLGILDAQITCVDLLAIRNHTCSHPHHDSSCPPPTCLPARPSGSSHC